MTADGRPPITATPPGAGGPCSACRHERETSGLVEATLAALPAPLRRELRAVATDLATSLAAPGVSAGPTYCGEAELAGRRDSCEERNATLTCTGFTPSDATDGAATCDSCAFLDRSGATIVGLIVESADASGDGEELMAELFAPLLAATALVEVHGCVTGDGVMTTTPRFLPTCVMASASGPLVGPSVNRRGRCAMWADREGATQPLDDELAAAVARRSTAAGSGGDDERTTAHEALVRLCLRRLGVDDPDAENAVSAYVAACASGRPATIATPVEATALSEPPDTPTAPLFANPRPPTFSMVPDRRFTHPRRPDVSIYIQVRTWETVAVIEQRGGAVEFDLKHFPARTWAHLRNPEGDLVPLGLCVDLPDHVEGIWY